MVASRASATLKTTVTLKTSATTKVSVTPKTLVATIISIVKRSLLIANKLMLPVAEALEVTDIIVRTQFLRVLCIINCG